MVSSVKKNKERKKERKKEPGRGEVKRDNIGERRNTISKNQKRCSCQLWLKKKKKKKKSVRRMSRKKKEKN